MRHSAVAGALVMLGVSSVSAEGPCDEAQQDFLYRFDVSRVSDSEVRVEVKTDENSTFIVSKGEYFEGMRHKHGWRRYQLVSMEGERFEFLLHAMFDARSFGGEVEECERTIIVEE